METGTGTGTLAVFGEKKPFACMTIREACDFYKMQAQIQELIKTRIFGLISGYLESVGYEIQINYETQELLVVAMDDPKEQVLTVSLSLSHVDILTALQDCMVLQGVKYRRMLYDLCRTERDKVLLAEIVRRYSCRDALVREMLLDDVSLRLRCKEGEFWDILHRLDLALESWGVKCKYDRDYGDLTLSYTYEEAAYTLEATCNATALYGIYAFARALELVKRCQFSQSSESARCRCTVEDLQKLSDQVYAEFSVPDGDMEFAAQETVVARVEKTQEIEVTIIDGTHTEGMIYPYTEPQHFFFLAEWLVAQLDVGGYINRAIYQPKFGV